MIEPVYDHEGITIYCADIFDVLPQLAGQCVSFVWADPPYGIRSVQASGVLSGRESANSLLAGPPPTVPVGGAKQFGKLKSDSRGESRARVIKSTVYPVVIGDESAETAEKAFCALTGAFPKARQVWWGANHYSEVLPASSSWLVWDKENTANFADAELAYTNHPGAVRICRHRWNGLLKGSERTEKRFHPNQKPVYLAIWSLERFGKQGDVILEPFMGSGPALRAAKRMNRRAIGVELSMDYCEQVIRRLEQGGLDLFDGDEPEAGMCAEPGAVRPDLFSEDGDGE